MRSNPVITSPVLGQFPERGLTLQQSLSSAVPDALRGSMEGLIQQHFYHVYGARISTFLPELLGMTEHDGTLQAVIGLRDASSGPLFLEQYLDESAESAISRLSGMATPRSSVVEVGNLVSVSTGMARLLIITLTHYLYHRGYRWVTFTGTPLLINSFFKLQLSPVDLATADPARLGADAESWGSYYATNPRVMAGYIPEGYAQLERSGIFERIGYCAQYSAMTGQEANHACA